MLIIYTIIAVDKIHPSYESHCPPNDENDENVDGKSLDTCLSCYWDNSMEWFMEGGADHTLDELLNILMRRLLNTLVKILVILVILKKWVK